MPAIDTLEISESATKVSPRAHLSFGDLPNEIQAHILTFLDGTSVNKLIKYTDINLSGIVQRITSDGVSHLADCGDRIPAYLAETMEPMAPSTMITVGALREVNGDPLENLIARLGKSYNLLHVQEHRKSSFISDLMRSVGSHTKFYLSGGRSYLDDVEINCEQIQVSGGGLHLTECTALRVVNIDGYTSALSIRNCDKSVYDLMNLSGLVCQRCDFIGDGIELKDKTVNALKHYIGCIRSLENYTFSGEELSLACFSGTATIKNLNAPNMTALNITFLDEFPQLQNLNAPKLQSARISGDADIHFIKPCEASGFELSRQLEQFSAKWRS